MSRYRARRGSALLIVLGMIAFMVISAVAFSAFMRSSRLPSSYLRRSSSSRLLAKAALAEAIEEIDAAIGNNPHPGVGSTRYRFPRTSGDIANRNFWADRVYIGSTNTSSSSVRDNFVSPDATVSVLNLEALAYLPPPLINEVRYYSRRSTAAIWHDLSFDAGRYAFCAVDVSDFFDVNVVTAGSGLNGGSDREIPAGRNSSDTGRITLAHSFENSSHNGYINNTMPADWDKFMDDYVVPEGESAAGKLPLISVADMNLAIHEKKPGGMKSPFGQYVASGTPFVQSENGNDAELMRGETFVTDSLFVSTNNTATKMFDISNAKYQPFSGFPSDKDNANEVGVDDMLSDYDNDFVRKYVSEKQVFGDPEFIQLYDYLDVDSIPTSLALPTVERTPMITGVMLDAEDFVVKADAREEFKDINETSRYAITLYDLKITGKLNVLAGLVYPFKYKRSAEQFKVQAAATVALVPKGAAFALRRPNAKSPILPNWSTSASSPTVQYINGTKGAVVTMVSAQKGINLKDSVLSEDDAVVAEVEIRLGDLDVALNGLLDDAQKFNSGSEATLGVSRLQKKVDDEWADTADAPTVLCGMPPVNADLSGSIDNPGEDEEFVPVVQVWVRILDANSKVVDLVPACAADDDKASSDVLGAEVNDASAVRPLLRFAEQTPTKVFKYTRDGLGTSDQDPLEVWPKAYITDDPRFNYAPENFIAIDQVPGSVSDKWFEMQRSSDSNRDGDIFMAVSDAGYLQSVFEFANLLNISDFHAGKWGVLAGSAYDGKIRTSFGDCPANGAMWRTYSQYRSGGSSVDIADIFSEVESGSKGFRINPYTQSRSVMMAALANSPLDWWAASTNDNWAGDSKVKQAKKKQLDTLSEANKYTFSQHSGAQVQLKHDDLEKLADHMIDAFKANPGKTWETVFDGMNWEVGESEDALSMLCGQDLGNVELHSVDRKFLHGFWRECFAARQQLFLVFVRAEPTMMGSGASGKAAPQLGARAVALVWRDPAATATDVAGGQPRPHRSRLLFYRQFD